MIDAAWTGSDVAGNTGSGNYTTVAWVTGAGKGLTVTPAKGDTGKTLLLLNAGYRDTDGDRGAYGTESRIWSTIQKDATNAHYLEFSTYFPSGGIYSNLKLRARSLRCVRS